MAVHHTGTTLVVTALVSAMGFKTKAAKTVATGNKGSAKAARFRFNPPNGIPLTLAPKIPGMPERKTPSIYALGATELIAFTS
jgi:hypothetical protein